MRNHLKKFVVFAGLLSTLLLGVSGSAIADDNHAFPIFRTGVSARALAMGTAYTAVADDASAGYWNPAGLTGVEKFSLTTMMSDNMRFDRQYMYAALAYNFGTAGWGAFSWVNAGIDNIEEAGVNGPTGNMIDFDQHGFLFSYGNKMNNLHVGATLKVGYQKTADYSASGVGFDAGIKYAVGDNVFLGVSARDLGTKVGRTSVPVTWRVGMAAMAFGGFTFAGDIQKIQHRDNVTLYLGSEYDYEFAENYFGAIRGGVADGDFSIGAGLTVMKKYSIDYAYVTETESFLGENHRVSLSIAF
ncbi:MAG: PorV/PorQ family protein [bacterium]|nr:PorV/PorQ family protein [bacterium]